MLLAHWLRITAGWRTAFPQQRTLDRALAQALGSLCALGRRTISRAIFALGRQHHDWSAHYKLQARCHWDPNHLFQPILNAAMPFCRGRYLAVAMDDTRLRKTGKRIPGVSYGRDPMSPPFHCNLMLGLRFLQYSLLLPLYRFTKTSPRALPIRFLDVPVVPRPGRRAAAALWLQYRQLRKQRNLSQTAVASWESLRQAADLAGARTKTLLLIGDTSFCNRTHFRTQHQRVEILTRTRKDIRLCHRAPVDSRAFYGPGKFTPEQVRQDESIGWRKARVFYGGQWRKLRYKELPLVLWQSGSGRRPVRLLVLAPVPYQPPGRRRKYYRDPAYLLTTDQRATARELIQMYLDRWQIEVNHRDEKDTLGVGQAQVRSPHSVARQPAFVVASYSALLLASLLAFGPERTSAFESLPKWRKNAKRPSCLDLVTLLRRQMQDTSGKTALPFSGVTLKTLVAGANA